MVRLSALMTIATSVTTAVSNGSRDGCMAYLGEQPTSYTEGSIQRVNLVTGSAETLLTPTTVSL